jgi:aspartate/tyrosine/aromatic aminotransferase
MYIKNKIKFNKMKKSRFSDVPSVPKDKIFEALEKFKSSDNPNKMNLSIGMLLSDKCEPVVFKSLEEAEKIIQASNLNKEYPQFGGAPEFTSALQNLFFAPDSKAVKEERVLTVQMITGGAALRISAELTSKFISKKIHVSNLTFGPYKNIFSRMDINYYPYFNVEKLCLDVDAFLEYLNNIEEGSVINLQLSSHNPTALDFSQDNWDKICEVMKRKRHFAQFDVAYLGYGTGSIESDLYPIHLFSENLVEMFICYSSGKNFTNYSDDIGAIICVLNKKEPVEKIKSHLIILSRSLFSFVSLYGARLIEKILNTPELNKQWRQEIYGAYERLKLTRDMVISEFENQNVKINLNFLKSQSGIYLFLNLDNHQVATLAEKYAIFICQGGRVNLSGISLTKINYFVECIKNILY